MIYLVDTNIWIYAVMEDMPSHQAVQTFLAEKVHRGGERLAACPQVLHEFMHIVTDPRRFENPMSMSEAVHRAETIWCAREVLQLLPTPATVSTLFDLLRTYALGRKRILDTWLAALCKSHGISHVLTSNTTDFDAFPFLTPVSP